MILKRALRLIFVYCKARIRDLFQVENLTIHGVKVNIKHPNISRNLKWFFYNESYEADEIALLKKCLQSTDFVMEIGAGIGFLSSYCSKQLGSDRVVCYEANPFMIDKIQETHLKNDVNPTLKNCILSDVEGNETFFLQKDFWSSSTIRRSDDAIQTEVKKEDINKQIKFYSPSVLIMDIEGGEKDLVPVTDFASSTISKLIIEIHPHVIGSGAASGVIQNVIEQGFSINFEFSSLNVLLFER